MQRRMVDLMRGEGLPYGERSRTCNSRFAQELGKWADSPGEDGIHDALYRAYFAENRNIGEVEGLVRIAETVGLPGDEARDVLMERRFRDAVDADWVKARGTASRAYRPSLLAPTVWLARSPTMCWSNSSGPREPLCGVPKYAA